ncbi:MULTISPECIES: TetR/AcrR family transcriptional regulator [unclassified Phycicoccus]|uniref:TetR/AcrR family transcriptional regulator n=1 Tax=unclassified Phycicoccus TaxID=2637926 RepID=UPI000B2CF9A3|nr:MULTISPECIES: TetR/AcrR family transcriptional regulator [unclassified Phycicoccus]
MPSPSSSPAAATETDATETDASTARATGARPSPARERILETAFALFYARGIRAVGVDLIIAESGVAKATFYKHFPAKDDLVLAYLDKVDGVWSGQLHAAAQAAGPAPADQLVGLFDALQNACRRDGYRGCGFINAAAESQPGTPVHERTVAHKASVLSWVEDLARRAGARDATTLARSLTLLLDGGLASGTLDAAPEAPRAAKEAAGALVAASLA